MLALAAQAAERLESDLKQLEQVGQALAVLAQEAGLDEKHLEAWMRGMVERDQRINGLTLAFEPGHAFGQAPAAEPAEYCLYVSRKGGEIVREHLHAQGYRYRQWDWYEKPVRSGQARWAPAPSRDEGGANTPIAAYLAPLQRHGSTVGVVAVDLSLQDFFGAGSRLGNCLDQLHLGQRGRSYGFVVSHTRTLWDGDDPGKESRRFWNGEPGTGVFISHPRYAFPQRIQDLPDVPAEFSALVRRMLQRDVTGALAEQRGKARAVEPTTGKRSTFLFLTAPAARGHYGQARSRDLGRRDRPRRPGTLPPDAGRSRVNRRSSNARAPGVAPATRRGGSHRALIPLSRPPRYLLPRERRGWRVPAIP